MTAKKRIVFVVNPISGTQGKKAILKWIDERIDRALFDYSIVNTPVMPLKLQLRLPKTM